MARCLALLLAALLPLSAQAQSTPPAEGKRIAAVGDPARLALEAWLEAFNTHDRARLEAFRDRYQPTFDVDGMLGFHAQTGGFRLLRHEPSAPGSAQALLQEAGSDTVARVTVTLAEGKPLALDIEAVERPADLRIPRLAQAGAIAALAAQADAAAAEDAFSGVLLVARGDEVLLQRAWGLADRAAGTPVTLDTRFRLGSMNKMFTAVAVLQLVEAGRLSLEGSVGQSLPGYPNADIAKVT
ncbi:MAG: beta-lactamase family protein, partial [Xanthomonadales bacterium]|nr:beta-lactamase family protein [Xanthomonadales bacterium]